MLRRDLASLTKGSTIAAAVLSFLTACVLLQLFYLLLPAGLQFGLLLYPAVLVVVVTLTFALRAWKWPMTTVTMWVVATVLQNLFIGSYLSIAPGAFDRLLLPMFEIKSAILIAAVLGLLVAKAMAYRLPPLCSLDGWLVIFVALAAVSFASSHAPFVAKAAYLRNFSAFALLHLLGRWSFSRDEDAEFVLTLLVVIGALLTIVSCMELLHPTLWKEVLNGDRIEAAKGPISHVSDFLGHSVRRLQSAVGEPVNAGYVFACLSLAALTTGRFTWMTFFVAQLVLTFAKGPMLICGVGVLLWGYLRWIHRSGSSPKAWHLLVIAFIAVVPAVAYVGLTAIRVPFSSTTTWPHIVGLLFGLSNAVANPLGQGLGTGGNYRDVAGLIGVAARPASTEWLQSGGESAVGVVATQLGLIGLMAFACSMLLMLGEAWKAVREFHRDDQQYRLGVAVVACAGLLGLTLTSLLQEGALSPQASGVFYLLSGIATGMRIKRNQANENQA